MVSKQEEPRFTFLLTATPDGERIATTFVTAFGVTDTMNQFVSWTFPLHTLASSYPFTAVLVCTIYNIFETDNLHRFNSLPAKFSYFIFRPLEMLFVCTIYNIFETDNNIDLIFCPPSFLIAFFAHLKFCFARATHNFKWLTLLIYLLNLTPNNCKC